MSHDSRYETECPKHGWYFYEDGCDGCERESGPAAPAPPDLARARKALWNYGQHKTFCQFVRPVLNDAGDETIPGVPCDCGLHAELEASRVAPAPKGTTE